MFNTTPINKEGANVNTEAPVTLELARNLIGLLKHGLCSGLGRPEPGKMCIMAAINYATGNPHGDKPTCIHPIVRSFDIKLNDAGWSSNKARAKGMARGGVAKLGSTNIDGGQFLAYVSLETVKRIVPIALRAAAKLNPEFAHELEAVAVGCETVKNRDEAVAAAQRAAKVAKKVRNNAVAYATDAAYAAVAYATAATAASYTATAASYTATAATDAAYATYAVYAGAAYATRDSVLTISAEIETEALILCGSEGAKLLPLLEKELTELQNS